MGTTIVINDERMGGGPEELGAKLMGTFLRKLCGEPAESTTIVFYGAGVRLLARGVSGVLDAIELLKHAWGAIGDRSRAPAPPARIR